MRSPTAERYGARGRLSDIFATLTGRDGVSLPRAMGVRPCVPCSATTTRFARPLVSAGGPMLRPGPWQFAVCVMNYQEGLNSNFRRFPRQRRWARGPAANHGPRCFLVPRLRETIRYGRISTLPHRVEEGKEQGRNGVLPVSFARQHVLRRRATRAHAVSSRSDDHDRISTPTSRTGFARCGEDRPAKAYAARGSVPPCSAPTARQRMLFDRLLWLQTGRLSFLGRIAGWNSVPCLRRRPNLDR